MNDLLRYHPVLVEEYLGALEVAADHLLALTTWSAEAPICCTSPREE
jgi:hypothetical protein